MANRYRILRFIAQGGMGEVYEAEDVTLGERIALKTVSAERSGDPRADEYFRRELLLARRVTHPNVCRLFDVGVHRPESGEPVRFLTMELLGGETLAERIHQGGPFAPAEALPVVRQMAAALAAAHAVAVVHRDFKSHNVMLVGPRAVVTDFGLARAVAGETGNASLSDSGRLIGTPHYIAPEQVEGGAVGPAADVYALGVVVFEMMTGALPFEGDTAMATAVRRLTTPAPSPRKFAPAIDARWEQVILACLARDPAARPQSPIAVVEQLEGAAPALAPRARWPLVLAILVLAGTGAWLLVRGKAARPATAARSRPAVAILGFENRAGRPDAAWLSTALAEMLSTELAAGGELRTVPAESVARVRRELAITAADGLAGDTLERLRAALGVDYVVLGSYVEVGDARTARVRLDLRLQDAQNGEIVLAAAETAAESELFDLVSRAGASLRARLGAAAVSESEAGGVRASLPGSSDAARLYAEGLAHLRAYDFLVARDTLAAATRAEPDFALSHAALAVAWSSLGHDPEARREARRALDLGAHLPRADRLLVEARWHEAAHEWKQGIDVWRSLFAFFPDQLEYGLGLAHAQTKGGDARAALDTLASLRRLPSPAGDDARLDYAAAEAYDMLSDTKHVEEAAHRAAEKARARGERILAAEAMILEGWSLNLQAEPARARRVLEEAKSLFAAVGMPRGVAQARHNLAMLQQASDLEGAVREEREVLATFRALGDDLHASWAENMLAIMLSENGDLEGGRRGFDEARQLARAIGATVDEGYATLNVGATLARQGDLAGARKWLTDAVALFRQVGSRRGEGGTLGDLANVRRLEGDLGAARKEVDVAIAILRESGARSDEEVALVQRCAMAVEALDRALAKTQCAEARAIKSTASHGAGALVQEAELLRLDGRADDALLRARTAAEAARTRRDALDEAGARELEARLLLARGDLDGAAHAAEAARAAEQKYPETAVRLALGITAARIEAARGHGAEARRALRKVLDEAQKGGMVSVELAARIAQAALARDSAALAKLARDASARGFGAMAADARP